MRRLAVVAAALLALGTPAPASAAPREVVIRADGPAYAVVTLRDRIQLGWSEIKVETQSRYAMLVAEFESDVTAVVAKLPGWHERFPYNGYRRELPAGRVTLRLMTLGPTTIRIPVEKGSRGLSVRLNRRLQGASAALRAVPPTLNVARDAFPIRVVAPAFVVHGWASPIGGALTEEVWACVTPGTTPCVSPPRSQFPGGPGMTFYDDRLDGDYYAKLLMVEGGLFSGPVTHYVISVPLR